MGQSITFRLDAETARIVRELRNRDHLSNSELMRIALRSHWKAVEEQNRPTSWEVYQQLYPRIMAAAEGEPRHDRARHAKRLVREKLIAKRREGTL